MGTWWVRTRIKRRHGEKIRKRRVTLGERVQGKKKKKIPNLKTKTKKGREETVGKEDKRQEKQDRKGCKRSRKMFDPDLGSLINFAMRHTVGETGGHSAERIIGTELFFLHSNADFRVLLPPLLWFLL